jgi:hypothetical protein
MQDIKGPDEDLGQSCSWLNYVICGFLLGIRRQYTEKDLEDTSVDYNPHPAEHPKIGEDTSKCTVRLKSGANHQVKNQVFCCRAPQKSVQCVEEHQDCCCSTPGANQQIFVRFQQAPDRHQAAHWLMLTTIFYDDRHSSIRTLKPCTITMVYL